MLSKLIISLTFIFICQAFKFYNAKTYTQNSRNILSLSNVNNNMNYDEKLDILSSKATTEASTGPLDILEVPYKGIIDYIGNTKSLPNGDINTKRWNTHHISYKNQTKKEMFLTRFNLWKQYPWKKFKGEAVIKIKVGGSLSIESISTNRLPFSGPADLSPINSLSDFMNLLLYSAYDPRIKGIFMEIENLSCGYAKLQELRRMMEFFKQSGKEIIGYAETASEKEIYLSLGCNEFYVPPDGGISLRGFSASATFIRGVFDKIGIEPQVQRIGKYKSFGDTFNRTSISEAQREVISSLLSEASEFWLDTIANDTNKTYQEIKQLWSEKNVLTPYQYQNLGIITGVKYLDQVEDIVKYKFSKQKPLSWFTKIFQSSNSNTVHSIDDLIQNNPDLKDFQLENDFKLYPRRKSTTNINETLYNMNITIHRMNQLKDKQSNLIIPRLLTGGGYLRRMRLGARILQGLPYKEVRNGPRIAIINAVGSITSGDSGSSLLGGKSIGSNTFISLIKQAKADNDIKAVVIRIDSPGGSALASDVMWREIRSLSRLKPVIASQVDVAASGGYYLSMACDEIISEELSVTGSIGVVTSKFNAEKLNEKIGYTTETLSIGRYAELFSTTRGFTKEEADYFEDNAMKFYQSFITKAAASRSMDVSSMNEVAQGRVWTGLQASKIGLVDHIGGLWKALEIATNMSAIDPSLLVNHTSTTATSLFRNSKSSKSLLDRQVYKVQILQEPKKGFTFPFTNSASSISNSIISSSSVLSNKDSMHDSYAVCDDYIYTSGLVGTDNIPFMNMNSLLSNIFKSLQVDNLDITKIIESISIRNNYLLTKKNKFISLIDEILNHNNDFL